MLQVVQTFGAADLVAIRGDSQLLVDWRLVAGQPVPQLLIIDPVAGQRALVSLTGAGGSTGVEAGLEAVSTSRLTVGNGGLAGLVLAGGSHQVPVPLLAALGAPPVGVVAVTAQAGAAALRLDGGAVAGDRVAVLRHGDWLFLGRDGTITTHAAERAGWPQLANLGAAAVPGMAGIVALGTASVAGDNYLIAAMQGDLALAVLRIGTDGGLVATGTVARGALPLAQPTALATVTLGGRQLVVVTAQATSSVSVFELRADGALLLRDQIIDNRYSRFAGASALDIIEIGGQALVAVAGNDGGVTLLQLLPTGRLITRAVLVDTAATALQNVTALRFVPVGDTVELFALATGDGGVTRLRLDPAVFSPAVLGVTASRTSGTPGNDILTAPAAGGRVEGGAGDDILIAGPGRDTLVGGPGADLFVLGPDADGRDVIADFTPGEDLIDLSAFPRLHSLAAVGITLTAQGAELAIGTARIALIAGRRLTLAEVQAAIRLDTDRVVTDKAVPLATDLAPVPAGPVPPLSTTTPIPDPPPAATGRDPDRDADGVFLWLAGPHVYSGGGGARISYAAAPSGAVVDLSAPGRNGGAAAGHALHGFANVTGSAHDDRLTGDDRANLLEGGAGNDALIGGGGNDWLVPGPGNDTVDGGTGIDMISYADLGGPVSVDLGAGTAIATGKRDQIRNIENVTGAIWADLIIGDAGDNRLRGLGGYDWFVGSDGNDTYEGGTGRDTVSYALASALPGGVGVHANLQFKMGSKGQAEGDVYDSIESLTGSSHKDWLVGNDEANVLRGLAGDDIIYGYGGNDTIDGGPGNDWLDGGDGNDRITGGAGNDTIVGGRGWDTALYSGQRADYRIETWSNGWVSVFDTRGIDGADILIDMNVIEFADSKLWL